ncbi:MAG: hypothetical protein MUF65_09080, partial [Rubritepida sp.]|nr:hypothetical protein [Rubritepida sp.]
MKSTRFATLAATAMLGLTAPAAMAAPSAFNFTGASQSFTVAEAGEYRILARGASGGSASSGPVLGGVGAEAIGTFSLAAGTQLNLVVGGGGGTGPEAGGGGGGTFVF